MKLYGFSKLSHSERLRTLQSAGVLSAADAILLAESSSADLIQLSDQLIENSIGCFAMPLGVAPHFRINGKDYGTQTQ